MNSPKTLVPPIFRTSNVWMQSFKWGQPLISRYRTFFGSLHSSSSGTTVKSIVWSDLLDEILSLCSFFFLDEEFLFLSAECEDEACLSWEQPVPVFWLSDEFDQFCHALQSQSLEEYAAHLLLASFCHLLPKNSV